MLRKIIKEILKKEKEIIKNTKNKTVVTIDTTIDGRTWRRKTEYKKNSAGKLEIKEYPAVILRGGI
jgi:hypothetical protein